MNLMVEKKQRVYGIFGIVLLALVVGFGSGLMISNGAEIQPSSNVDLSYKADVCVYKNGELQSCNHNVLYNSGKNSTRDALAFRNAGNFTNLTVCNASAGCGGFDTSLDNYTAYNNCGLQGVAGLVTLNPTVTGNWSITNTFTSSCDSLSVNATKLTNTTGGVLAGNSFTTVTLQTNDQLTINWTLGIS